MVETFKRVPLRVEGPSLSLQHLLEASMLLNQPLLPKCLSSALSHLHLVVVALTRAVFWSHKSRFKSNRRRLTT